MNKVILTGGPSSGKTIIAQWLQGHHQNDTVLLPEAATILYRGGFPRFDDKVSRNLQQEAIYKVQSTMEKISGINYPKDVVICDRGTLDGLAYWVGGDDEFYKTMKTNYQHELDSYSACIFMQSPSEKDYERVSIRTESYEHACGIEERLHKIWGEHPNFYFVERKESFVEKCEAANSIFKELLAKFKSA